MRALDALRAQAGAVGGTPVLFYGFDDLTPLQLDAIETLGRGGRRRGDGVAGLRARAVAFAGRAGDVPALAPLAAEHRELQPRAEHYRRRLALALSHLERSLFEPDAARVEPGERCGCWRAAASGPSSSWSPARSASCSRRASRPRRSPWSCAPPRRGAELLEEVFAAAGDPVRARAPPAARRHARRAAPDRPAALRAAGPRGGAREGEAGRSARVAAGARAARAPRAGRPPGDRAARRTGVTSAARARALWERAPLAA